MKWAYGLTTVGGRRKDLLPRTLASLRAGGFDRPRLFVDGTNDIPDWETEFGLDVTARTTPLRTYGNWTLALAELYLREPLADRYAVFQDDFVTYRNLREYLEHCKYPDKGYWNLYSFPRNEALAPADKTGWFKTDQKGKGAVALVFDRKAVLALLSNQHMVERPLNVHKGHKSVDGGLVTAAQLAGWTEYAHMPSLVQHTGVHSSMGNRPHQLSGSFRGEETDALTFFAEPRTEQ